MATSKKKSTTKSNTYDKQKEYLKRQKDSGMMRTTVQIPERDNAKHKKYCESLRKKFKKEMAQS